MDHIILLLCMPGHFLLDARHELYLVNIPINILELFLGGGGSGYVT